MTGVTPTPGLHSEVVTAGTPVQVAPGSPEGGAIVNPYGGPGVLYVNPIGDATTDAVGNTFALQPGQRWDIIPGQTTPTSVNSTYNNHEFSAYYLVPSP